MDRSALQALQAPLKEKYKEAPDAAVWTLKADGTLGEENVSCSVETGRALVEAGLHEATGGNPFEVPTGREGDAFLIEQRGAPGE